jgi:D-alanyl-D-alanine carboxypeptidase (penicillin-binding protein 5/6)
VPVAGAATPTIAAVAPRDLFITLPRGFAMERKVSIAPRAGIAAPLPAGAVIADLVVTMPGQPPAKLPLVTAAPVPQANVLQRAWNWLTGLVG